MNAKKIAKSSPMNLRDTLQMWFHLTMLSDIGKALVSSLDTKEILNIVMDKIGKLLNPKNWSLLLIDEATDELKFEIVVGEGADKIKGLSLKPGEGIAGWVAMKKKPLLIPDVSKDPRFSKKVDEISNFVTKSVFCVPLIARDKCLGAIELINVERGKFNEEDELVLTTIADYTAIAIENAKHLNKIQELTITDDLTGLYNKRLLHSRLKYEIERAKRFKSDVSLIFIDLNFFKEINDRYGHLTGDKLLREFSKLILKSIRNVDMAFRYGGDEFVILMTDTTKRNTIIAAERFRRKIEKKIFLRNEKMNLCLTACIGIASFPADAGSKDDLINIADTNMYRLKTRLKEKVTAISFKRREGRSHGTATYPVSP